jgi:catechol 2,3-dioxygenase-like lactoylglutathione lyase family enzyme
VITVQDIAFVRYRAPDLDAMEGFLADFGMHRAVRTGSALYMRGHGEAHHLHVTELGDTPATLGFGLRAGSADDLSKLAAHLRRPVEDNPDPGGGLRVRCDDPAGFVVDVIYGQRTLEPITYREPVTFNAINGRRRHGQAVRSKPGPSHVIRLGHVFAQVAEFRACFDFYTQVLGFKASDSYFAGSPQNTVAVFLHCGLGRAWTDHHTIGLVAAQDGRSRLDHSAFEVIDLDDVVQGGEYLKNKAYKRAWGVGRHIQGSQIFDYWRDPFGHKVEHWTDGDLVNDESPVGHSEMTPGELAQWGPELTPEFFE